MHKFKLGFLINVRYWCGRVTTCSSQDNCLKNRPQTSCIDLLLAVYRTTIMMTNC